MDSIVKGLNDAQTAAVTSPAPVLQCLAPPGSGKTKTLTSRIAFLIHHHGLHPSNVIVCTFTIKAAKEMKQRIEGLLDKQTSTKLKLGTFHSVARRFLAIHGSKIGINGKFDVADTTDSRDIIARIIKRFRLSISPAIARSRISKLKAEGVTAERHVAESRARGKPDTAEQEFVQAFDEYQQQLEKSNLLDYDDLLLRCVELLRGYPECVSGVQAVFVDEFQDTNLVQYDLMNLFAQQRRTVTVVCDPDQSIYGWRSARMENIKKMQALYPEAHVINLEENYRSSSCILWAAQEVIEQDKSRHQKSLAPTHSPGELPTLRRLTDAAEEALWTVSEMRRVHALTGGLLTWDDFAILLRSAMLSRLIEKELGIAGIPYRMVGGQRFYDRVEIKLVLDYLRILNNFNHSEAVARVINVPARGVGEKTIAKLLQEADSRKQSLWAIVLRVSRGELTLSSTISHPAQKGLETFVNVMLRARARIEDDTGRSLADLIGWLIDRLELDAFLKSKYDQKGDYETRKSNIQELVAQAEEGFESQSIENEDLEQDELRHRSNEDRRLSKAEELDLFLANISLSADGKQDKSNEQDNTIGCVTLSTMHAAKGLEWSIVFIPAAYNGSIPHSRADDADEERRLLYVAMTRAQCLLYISCTKKDSRNGDVELSPFLQPKSVQQRHAPRGPSLTCDLIRELAKILRREHLQLDIEQGRAQAGSLEDDCFAQRSDLRAKAGDGSDDDDLEITGRHSMPNNYRKRKIEGVSAWSRNVKGQETRTAAYSVSTTMQSSGAYSISKATYNNTTTSFVSASTLPTSDKGNQTRRPASSYQSDSGKGRNQAHANQGQQSISRFFRSPPASADATLTEVPADTLKQVGAFKSPATASGQLWSTSAVDAGAATSGPNAAFRNFKPSTVNNQPAAARKTLGVRREVNSGWSARMLREAGRP